MAADKHELVAAVKLDKQRAYEVRSKARTRADLPIIQPVAEDITGSPSGTRRYMHDSLQVRKELEVLRDSPFFARVDVQFAGETEPIAILLTKARAAGEVYDDGNWEVISFTSPLYEHVLDREIGTRFKPSNGEGGVIGTSAKFESLLPQLQRADYFLRSGRAFVESETSLDIPTFAPTTKRTPKAYKAATTFSLGEIIELADRTQRSAMHLPFVQSVLIEGPPGSGKTSVGIMRIPCLLDRQWEELGLDPQNDKPFHLPTTMRVLVLNEEMVDYLGDLVRSLRIEGVDVGTLHDLLLRLCDDAGVLKGRAGREPPFVAKLKSKPQAITAYWRGFQASAKSVFTDRGDEYRAKCEQFGDMGKSLWKVLQGWFSLVESSCVTEGALPDTVNLAVRAADWQAKALQSVPDAELIRSRRATQKERNEVARINAERDGRLSEISSLREVLRDITADLFDRRALVRAMFETDEYRELLRDYAEEKSTEDAEKADKAWREQFAVDMPTRTEYDVVLAAWLASHVALVPASGKVPIVGGQLERFTHLMVDEAQDLSSTHANILQRLIVKGGTLTFVGDLRQRLGVAGGLNSWDELGVSDLRPAAFTVNHRQSFELGQFVAALQSSLFGEVPVWKPSEERRSKVPRVRIEKSQHRFAAVVAEEVRLWRREIPHATIGVLYDGRWTPERARKFRGRLEDDLASDSALTIVHIARNARGGHLRKTNCVFVASVASTKGLEFDAVVFIDPVREWADTDGKPFVRQKHGLYVATSRGKQGLSLVLRETPSMLQTIAESGVCSIIYSQTST